MERKCLKRESLDCYGYRECRCKATLRKKGNASQESCEGYNHLRSLIQASIAGSARVSRSAEIAITPCARCERLRERERYRLGRGIERDVGARSAVGSRTSMSITSTPGSARLSASGLSSIE